MSKHITRHSTLGRQLCVVMIFVQIGITIGALHHISQMKLSDQKRRAIEAVLFHSSRPRKRVECRPCVESVVYDLTQATSLAELDEAIAPRTSEEEVAFDTLFLGARIRLAGVAAQDRKQTAIKLINGETVAVGGFRFDNDMVEKKVVIEGCVSRYWNPTWRQRENAISQLPTREQPLHNTVTAHIPGVNYVIIPKSVRLE